MGENNFSIRTTLKIGDLSSIGLMHAKFYGSKYNYSIKFEKYILECLCEFYKNYALEKNCLWIAESNGEIIGSIGVVGNEKEAQLRWFLIDEKYRGLGLGKSLLDKALHFCKAENFTSIKLVTTNDLDRAIKMYEKSGFNQTYILPNTDWNPETFEVGMNKILK